MFELKNFITKTNFESKRHTDFISCTFNYFLFNFPFFVIDKNTKSMSMGLWKQK